mmetsp:Transcript_14769/g.22541  ORF Transcript_14769/g.22541 Transcript_14769/m.22541 type:complete len:84 (-) Transcript_14769:185-436(-)
MEELLLEIQLDGNAAAGRVGGAHRGSRQQRISMQEDAAVEQAVERLLLGLLLRGVDGAKLAHGGTSQPEYLRWSNSVNLARSS